jgi:hypothetical protein
MEFEVPELCPGIVARGSEVCVAAPAVVAWAVAAGSVVTMRPLCGLRWMRCGLGDLAAATAKYEMNTDTNYYINHEQRRLSALFAYRIRFMIIYCYSNCNV